MSELRGRNDSRTHMLQCPLCLVEPELLLFPVIQALATSERSVWSTQQAGSELGVQRQVHALSKHTNLEVLRSVEDLPCTGLLAWAAGDRGVLGSAKF
jgi:hypothetical protein